MGGKVDACCTEMSKGPLVSSSARSVVETPGSLFLLCLGLGQSHTIPPRVRQRCRSWVGRVSRRRVPSSAELVVDNLPTLVREHGILAK